VEVLVSYLTELLAGYRQGIARDLTESTEALQAALKGEDNPARRGIILGLLAQSLVQQDRQLLTIDKPKSARPLVTEESQTISPRRDAPCGGRPLMGLPGLVTPQHSCRAHWPGLGLSTMLTRRSSR
jgi:hypothetical protein